MTSQADALGLAITRQRRGQRLGGRIKGYLFQLALLFSLVIGIVTLGALLAQVVVEGWPRLNLDLVRHFPSSRPLRAGAQSAIFGTIWLMGIVMVTAIPVGFGAAIYLEEYANPKRWYNRLIELNLQNLAAVPSIVYGILGLGIIARGLGLGRTLLTGGLTLTLLVLPIVIIAGHGLRSQFSALPIQIFNWISRPQAEFKVLAAAAIVVLLAVLLAMNAVAIWLRNRYQKRW